MSYFAAANDVAPVFIPEMSRELSPKDLISLWKVYRRIVREKPDIIHTHTAKAGTIGRAAGFLYRHLNRKNVRLVHTYHGHVFHSYYGKAKTRFFLAIEKFLARATDKIIVISPQQKQEINEKFGIGKPAKFEVIPLGIDLRAFADHNLKRNILREEIGAADEEIIVGIVGRLTEIKNHKLFLQIVKICGEKKENFDLPLKFVIIGDGHLRRELENEAEALKIKDSVIFLGNRADADVFYAGLDIVALTSLNEGTPLSLIEAMANEKPVIATNVGGVADLLGDAKKQTENFTVCERGISVRSQDAHGFAAGLKHLAADRRLRLAFGESGKKFVLERYDKKRLADDIKKLYLGLARG
jgi:glycosyltransferase involved in cell wall biosynthesis